MRAVCSITSAGRSVFSSSPLSPFFSLIWTPPRVPPCGARRERLNEGADLSGAWESLSWWVCAFRAYNPAFFTLGRPRLAAYSLPSIGATCGGSRSR